LDISKENILSKAELIFFTSKGIAIPYRYGFYAYAHAV
jgi:hypothetical protein